MASQDPSTVEEPTRQINGIDVVPVSAHAGDDESVADESPVFASTASMATEILSASPEIATVGVPETPESELISKDLTLIARGRRKRFRLH
jgi:hypothetical protein